MKIQAKYLAMAAALACGVSTQAQNTTYWADTLYQHNANDGGGGFNFNNGPILPGQWDDFADFGDLAFTASFDNGVGFNTIPAWNAFTANNPGSQNYIYPFGPASGGNTETYGQTFVAPAGVTKLQSYSFLISDFGDGAVFPYQALVTDWTGSLVGGSAHAAPTTILYASPTYTYTGDGSYETVTITIPDGGLSVTPGDDYFMGLTSDPGGSPVNPTGPGSAVPDAASTMALLSLGLGGIAALRRKI